jgi:hypothetical protein
MFKPFVLNWDDIFLSQTREGLQCTCGNPTLGFGSSMFRNFFLECFCAGAYTQITYLMNTTTTYLAEDCPSTDTEALQDAALYLLKNDVKELLDLPAAMGMYSVPIYISLTLSDYCCTRPPHVCDAP